jgi:NADH-ubiquinone oxidoreductase chain 4L
MIIIFIYLIPMCSVLCIVALVIQRRHFLMGLLALEGVILGLALLRVVIYPVELYSVIIILTMGACEARLGLRVMVIISRSFGNDLFLSVNSNKC